MPTITGLSVADVRFPTSRTLDGSDAMNPDPDYSAAYLTLETSEGERGYSLVFTIGHGNRRASAADSRRSSRSSGDGTCRPLWPISEVSPGSSSATRSSVGWARRRASCIWRPEP